MNINPIAFLGILDGVVEMFQEGCQFVLNAGFEVFMKFASFGDVLNKSYGILLPCVDQLPCNAY